MTDVKEVADDGIKVIVDEKSDDCVEFVLPSTTICIAKNYHGLRKSTERALNNRAVLFSDGRCERRMVREVIKLPTTFRREVKVVSCFIPERGRFHIIVTGDEHIGSELKHRRDVVFAMTDRYLFRRIRFSEQWKTIAQCTKVESIIGEVFALGVVWNSPTPSGVRDHSKNGGSTTVELTRISTGMFWIERGTFKISA